ncbi:MAG: heparinase II/III family protein, partial [Candidatus Omnitrophica bacterium]|nr:heparinase II/III family protein [Candidatus Omnitrophota bacterium]
RWLDGAFDENGANCEGTAYAVYALSNSTLFIDALKRNGGPNLFDHPHLRRVPHFYAMSLLPGESVFDARNDADYAGFWDPFMLRLSGEYNDGLAKWLFNRCFTDRSFLEIVWENSVEPRSPWEVGEPLEEHFPGRGLCIFRTGWEEDDVQFSIESGPFFRKTHNQADKGHFTLYGLGHRWAIDSGYGNSQDPNGKAQTVAHNSVLIDGSGQALSGAGLGTSGQILDYQTHDEYGYVLADCGIAYNHNSDGHPGIGVKKALRHAFFVRPKDGLPAYTVILDDIRKDDSPHQYTWLLHTDSEMAVEVGEATAEVTPTSATGEIQESPRLLVYLHAVSDPTLEVDQYLDHPRLKGSTEGVNPRFAALLLPLPAENEYPEVDFQERDGALHIDVRWKERKDSIVWPETGETNPKVYLEKSSG